MVLTRLSLFPASVSWLTITGIAFGLLISYRLYCALCNVYFHPLSKYPGSKLYAASTIPCTYHVFKGTRVHKTLEQHAKYGPVVRVAPNKLFYIREEAWKDIYSTGSRKGEAQLMKHVLRSPNQTDGIFINPVDAVHARIRKTVSHGFSEKAIRDREPLLQHYTGLLMRKLREHATGESVNMLAWYECATVDMIGEFLFGEPFDCLETSKVHPISRNAAKLLKLIPILLALNDYGIKDMIDNKIERRLARGENSEIPDLMSYMSKLPDNERRGLSGDLLLGGANTTATVLSGATYLLARHESKLKRVAEEIRSEFRTEEEITLKRVNNLKYFAAVISESLRLLPAGPDGVKRITGHLRNVIAGQFVPPNTQVSVPHWAAYREPFNFGSPNSFIPERWLGDEKYRDDKRGVFQPYAVGPRNCVGQNLANAQMRLILARVLWNFDIELCTESADWMNVGIYGLVYDKGPLMVRLKPVKRNQRA